MKKFLHVAALAICTLIATVNANAQVITADRAQEIANSFFQNGKQKSAAVRSTAAVSMKKSADSRILTSESSSDAPTFHILTPASGEGFVIVSGEEMENPIIGYSFEGTIDTNDLPVGFVDYMTDIDAQVKALRKYNAENPQKAAAARSAMQKTNYAATTMGNIVVQIETAKWGQNTPFNDQCWTSAEQTAHAKTGCVPTAFAIIARYHQWPLEGIGNLLNQQTGVQFTDRTYDYSKMPLVYDSNATDEQKAEVAKLMAHLGHAFGVTWGAGTTSVSIGNTMSERMRDYFNYKYVSVSNQYDNGTMYDFDTWKSNLKSSLDNNCPVPYAADNSGTGDTRHMFVVDGYTENDYFHFNFGWNGGSNGWFTLKAITPSQGDNYSWDDTAEGYNSKHQAFFNLEPNKTKYTVNASVSPANAGTVSINGGDAASTATGEYLEGATVTLAATTNTGYTFSNWTKGGEIVSTAKSFAVNVTEAADYVANFLEISTTEEVNINITSNAGGTVKINGTATNSTSVAKNSSVTVTALPENGYIFSNWTDGTEEITTAEYTFVATDNKELTATFAVAPYYTITAEATAGGTATVNGSSTYSGQQNTTATLQATPNDGYYFTGWTVNGDKVSTQNPLEISIQGDKTYTANFANTTAEVSLTNPGGGYGTIDGTSTTSKTVNIGTTVTIEFVDTSDQKDFSYWTLNNQNGEIISNDNPYTFVVNEDIKLYPYRDLTGTDLNVAVSATATAGGSATITIDNNAITQAPLGEEVTLKAMPTAGYRFVKWTTGSGTEEKVISTEATCTAIVQAATTYTANFEVIEGGATTTQYTITATANLGTAGTATANGNASATVDENSSVTLTATPNNGYEFVNWTNNINTDVVTENPYTVTATANVTYTANFQTAAATTFAVTTVANPTEGGTATFAEGTGQATTSATVASGTGVTLYAEANDGYRFVNWTKGTTEVSTEATHNVTITEASDFVANFEEDAAAATEYPTPTGNTYTNNYLTSITTTGGDTNIDYSANAHPGEKLVVVPGKVQLAKGESFTMNLVAYSLGAGSSSVTREDMRYCHASLFTDFDQDFTFQAERVQGWGNQPPTNNVYGNYDLVMNITHTITVPDDAPAGESRIRMIYTNAWKNWPTNGTAELDKGIVYDIVVEVVEKVDITANASEGGTVTINGEATNTKRVIKGSEVTLTATANDDYSFTGWYDGETLISSDNPYTFTATANASYEARFEQDNLIDILLTDEYGNNYRDRIECDKDVNAVKTALLAKYPFIELDNNGVIEDNTFKCTVTLPFKVSNNNNTYWHNIYWPTGTNNSPVYMSALNDTDQYVSKVTENAAYGSSSYNTSNNNSKISWAIYSVNESLEFKFKNELTGQFIKVTSVANGNAQNTEFVADEAEATVFTLIKDTGSYNGDYSITAKVDDTTGYLCSTSALEYDYTTFYQGNSHQGAWVIFTEADYTSKIMDLRLAINLKFGAGEGKYIINDDIQEIITALEDAGNIKLNDLIAYGITTEDAINNWPKLQLAISPANSGTTSINGEDGITSKYAPVGYEMTVTATALTGYIFANWTNGTEEASSNAAHTFTLQGATNLTANFETEAQEGLQTGYYHLVSRDTNRHEHLYNNAFSSSNTNHLTLQSDAMVNTNNGIWYITANGSQLGIKNGDGKPVVAGDNNQNILDTFSNLNINTTINGDDGYTYYYFDEALNCSNTGSAFKVGNICHLTTWSDGGANAVDNQWRLEPVDTEDKNIYDVVVECAQNDVYVTYGNEYAFNGGFFITDATITAQELTAKKGNDAAEGVTVLVEGSTIRVVDTEYVDITVSATPAESGSVTINGEAESTLTVVKSSSVTVVATPVSGYHFVNWTDANSNIASTDATYTFTASENTSLVANFEADVVYHTITVSTYYDNNGGTATIGNEGATSVNVAEGGSVRMLATVAEGYEFMGWLKNGVIVKNAIDNGLEFEVQGPDYTLYEIKASAEYVAVFSKITDYTNLEDGKAYRICGVQQSARARCIYRDGNTLKWKYDYDDSDVNTIFVAQKNGNAINLISAVGYHGWKASNKLGNDEQYNPYAAIKVTYGTRDELRTLYIESGTTSGLYQTNTDGGFSFSYSIGDGLALVATDETTTDFLFEEVKTYAFQVSVADGSNAKLGTINLPFATTVPAGVTAYGVDYTEGEFVHMIPLTLTDNVLPANTPVLIEAETAGKFGFKPAPASNGTYDTGFAGTLEAEDIPGTTNAYILSYNGAGTHIMLYKLSSTSRKINANKAYYIDETGNAATISFKFIGTTEIDEWKDESEEMNVIYDLQGRKLSEIKEPGIYIINGKKVYKK